MKATLALLVQGIHVISPVKFIVKVNTQVFVFCKPSLFPNPGCTLVRSVVSSIRNWSPSSLYYRCLYAVKVVDDPPIYLFIPFRHTSNDGELLEVTIHSSVCEELWKWRTSYLTKVNIKENRSLNTDVYGKPPHDQDSNFISFFNPLLGQDIKFTLYLHLWSSRYTQVIFVFSWLCFISRFHVSSCFACSPACSLPNMASSTSTVPRCPDDWKYLLAHAKRCRGYLLCCLCINQCYCG